jgi:hypothetical protein
MGGTRTMSSLKFTSSYPTLAYYTPVAISESCQGNFGQGKYLVYVIGKKPGYLVYVIEETRTWVCPEVYEI